MFNEATRYYGVLPSTEAFLVLSQLERFFEGALIQIGRVRRTTRSMMKPGKSTALRRLFLDAHTYFICIGQINKFFLRLCDELSNADLKKLHRQFSKLFDAEIRNDLEHLDERAVGKKFNKKQSPTQISRWNQDFVNFKKDSLTFGGKSYPVNDAAAAHLKSIYKDLFALLRQDYGTKNTRFMQDEQRDRDTRRITRLINSKAFKRRTGQNS